MRSVVLILVGFCIALWVLPHNADAARRHPHHYTCATVQACRNELARKDARASWLERKAAHDIATRAWPGGAYAAIVLAAHRLHVDYLIPGTVTVGQCESHLDPLAHNGTHLGVFQLSAGHRSDPLLRLLGWRDPYAQALHTLRIAKHHGFSAWECQPNGTVVQLG
jgi:hypothetical protein